MNPELLRCDAEIAEAERLLRNGHPDVNGLAMAVADWSQEKRAVEYEAFLEAKRISSQPSGFSVSEINPQLFDFQRDIVRVALKRGKYAIFADCGLGKTPMQLEWARHVCDHTGGSVLIVAPLAVSRQTKREGEKFHVPVTICRAMSDVQPGVNITNYEMLEHFQPHFAGIVLDESSILKGDGPMRHSVEDFAATIPYRLACTATPAPNDHMELGNHAAFLGIMSKSEMLSTFFVHDGENTSQWRLKGHAVAAFWKWVASWAVMIRKPSDLGYDDGDGDFLLLPIQYHQHTVTAEWASDYLFPVEAQTLRERQAARRDSLAARVKLCADLVNGSPERWICWCNLNDESEELAAAIGGAVEVTGSQSDDFKERALLDFAEGRIDRLVTKGKIAGFGMNFQACSNMAVVGLSDSWELLYQLVRRCWRFGQKRTVHVHVITGELEGAVVRNIERKERQAAAMSAGMLEHMRAFNTAEIHGAQREQETYIAKKAVRNPSWL
jgi:superfamily II DNA or RNA helicase